MQSFSVLKQVVRIITIRLWRVKTRRTVADCAVDMNTAVDRKSVNKTALISGTYTLQCLERSQRKVLEINNLVSMYICWSTYQQVITSESLKKFSLNLIRRLFLQFIDTFQFSLKLDNPWVKLNVIYCWVIDLDYPNTDRKIGVRFPTRTKDILFSTASKPTLGHTQPPTDPRNGYRWQFPRRQSIWDVKMSPPSSAEVKKGGATAPIPPMRLRGTGTTLPLAGLLSECFVTSNLGDNVWWVANVPPGIEPVTKHAFNLRRCFRLFQIISSYC
jgi:hypothetical protein